MARSEYSQLGSRNHSSAKELKSNRDGDTSSIYISRMIKNHEFLYQVNRMR